LILSDVVGDDLAVIASGPTVRPIGTQADAIAMLKDADLWDRVAPSIRRHLKTPRPATDTPDAVNILVGSNAQSVAAMADRAGDCHVILQPVDGDVRAAAKVICDAAGPGVTLWGGETTVCLRGTGKGGRNQELALWIALEAHARGWDRFTCLQAGSDGRDGPTDAAGGLVDHDTLARIAAVGGDAGALLAANDSYRALGLADALFTTGATGTNVADLGVLIREG
jgi:hydroxypyruvate reductase